MCTGIIRGDYDHLPESSFYMTGTIVDVQKAAEELAKKLAASK